MENMENIKTINISNEIRGISFESSNVVNTNAIVIGKVIGKGVNVKIVAEKPKINYERWKSE